MRFGRKEGWARRSLLRVGSGLSALSSFHLFQKLLDAFHVLLRKIEREM